MVNKISIFELRQTAGVTVNDVSFDGDIKSISLTSVRIRRL